VATQFSKQFLHFRKTQVRGSPIALHLSFIKEKGPENLLESFLGVWNVNFSTLRERKGKLTQ
jgi:hypothetical protein